MENNIKNVNVTLQANPFLEIAGPASQMVNFTQQGEQMIYFNVKVKHDIGIGKVKLVATSGGEKAGYDVELDIRNPNPPGIQYQFTGTFCRAAMDHFSNRYWRRFNK